MSYADQGRSEAEYYQRIYGGSLYLAVNGMWGVKDVVTRPGSTVKGSIIPLLAFGEGYGTTTQVSQVYQPSTSTSSDYWARVGSDFAKLPTQLVENILVKPAQAVTGGASDILREAAGNVGSGVGKGISELGKSLILPAAFVVGAVVLVLVVSSKTGTTREAAGVARVYAAR